MLTREKVTKREKKISIPVGKFITKKIERDENENYICFGDRTRSGTFFKVPLTPKPFFRLIKSTGFPDYFSEKIISIDKIPAFHRRLNMRFPCSRPRKVESGSGYK